MVVVGSVVVGSVGVCSVGVCSVGVVSVDVGATSTHHDRDRRADVGLLAAARRLAEHDPVLRGVGGIPLLDGDLESGRAQRRCRRVLIEVGDVGDGGRRRASRDLQRYGRSSGWALFGAGLWLTTVSAGSFDSTSWRRTAKPRLWSSARASLYDLPITFGTPTGCGPVATLIRTTVSVHERVRARALGDDGSLRLVIRDRVRIGLEVPGLE